MGTDTQGDFSVRIQPFHSIDSQSGFDVIIDCFDRMAEELSGVETLRTDFIANVSHELKTPLAVIQNYGTMLQRPGLTENERMEYAKAITAASRRLADLITNILKLNRLENQQIYPDRKTFDLGEQLCGCLLGFENTCGNITQSGRKRLNGALGWLRSCTDFGIHRNMGERGWK